MQTLLRSLTVASMLISYGCSHVTAPIGNHVAANAFVDRGFQPIDAANPPKDGVWATWDDAKAIANNNRLERFELTRKNIELESASSLLQKKFEAKEQEAIDLSSGWRSWLAHWGLPVGLLCGLGLGIGIAIGVQK
jgi:hypothetical protein